MVELRHGQAGMRQARVGAGRACRRLAGGVAVACLALLTTAGGAPAMGNPGATSAPASAASAPASAASAHDPIGVIVTGDDVNAPATMKTYSGDAYWLTKTELAALKSSRGASGAHADLWTTSRYSFCENHGTPVYGWSTAAGVGLEELLGDAGLSAAQIAALGGVTVTAAPDTDSYSTTLDQSQARFIFETVGGFAGDTVKPLLALYANDVEAYADLPVAATTAVDGDYTRLMFGQLSSSESNKCNYVADASLVSLPSASAAFVVDAPDAYGTDSDRQKTSFTLSTLVSEGVARRTYTVNGQTHTCDGLDLKTVLGEADGEISPQDRIVITTSAGETDPGWKVADVTDGAYLLAYYSEDASGTKVANGTQTMLYGDGVAIANVLSLTIEHVDPTAGLVLSSPTASQTRATIARRSKLALRAVVTKAPGATQAGAVTWTSGNAKVATVSGGGTVTARRAGSAVITVASGSFSVRFSVKVVAKARNATRVTLPKTKSLSAGATTRLAVRVSPSTATSTIWWKSGASRVATVDRGGTITAVSKGKTTITVRTSNGKTASCVVRVR